MVDVNPYEILGVKPTATQAQIHQAYRRLVKRYHPDVNPNLGDREQIVRLNLAYETLSDPDGRRVCDRQFYDPPASQPRQKQRSARRSTPLDPDQHWQQWLKQVYYPVSSTLGQMIDSIETEIEALSADPFDDELLANFQTYLTTCHFQLEQIQKRFRSLPNPNPVASIAAHLYYCLNQVSDGLEEFYWFTQNYDDHYLHTGLELFRIADGLRQEAQEALQEVYAIA